ncbi:oncostatin-M-specific receptor subunit beta [Mastacembelus armatus]|uniref:oncostatin-M-specific receptor subunit beta n=1 Tax=Mastacembelus armatus TaxID=205130 RepID=UPI000E462689|nr:oncostatin-M-specific receptor subunit beta-like [Mastacembelus armatus]
MVKNKLGEETESYSFNISDRVSPIVEVDRVIPGVTNTTVSWIVQGNLTQLTLLCQVATEPHTTIEELICKSLDGCCKVRLEHLLPNTRYSTRVRCSVNRRLWGKWTQPVSFTTRLSKDPSAILNLWRTIKQLSDPHSRNVTLLWTLQVPGSATTVITQGYTVQWSQEGVSRTEWKDSGQTQAEVSIGQGQYNFTVQAVLHSGLTISDHITVPKMDDRENLPVVRRLTSSASGGFNLSWAEQVTATCGYTVEWCILGPAVPFTLQWMKTSKGVNTLFLHGRHFKAGCRYEFNISECTENGHRLLEIQTGYSQELKSVQSPSLVGPAQSTSSSVTLEWHYNEDNPAHSAFITGYLVTVQEVGSEILPGQAANMFNVSVEDPRRKTVTIEGLQPSHEYALFVSALTSKGPGQPASITIRTRTNYSVHLAKILAPILLLLGCIILLWPQRKLLKNGLKEIFVYPAGMNIKTSELHTFLNKTDERVLHHKVEDCISCDIEILDTHPPLNEAINQASSMALSCAPLQADYRPQSAVLLCTTPALQQIKCIANRSYFDPMAGDVSEPQVTFSEIKSSFEPSDCLQESCSIICDYISSDTLQL